MPEMKDKLNIGIDIGATKIVVAGWLTSDSRPFIILDADENRTTNTCVGFIENQRLLGFAAETQSNAYPESVIFGRDVKALIGKKQMPEILMQGPLEITQKNSQLAFKTKYNDADIEILPEQVLAMLLEFIKDNIYDQFPEYEIGKCVITVPFIFNEVQTSAMLDACMASGFDYETLDIINSSTAAALTYIMERYDGQEKKLMIFDMGATMIDYTILHLTSDKIIVESQNGISDFGGENFTQCIIDRFVNESIKSNKQSMARLRKVSEKIKKTLSLNDKAKEELPSFLNGKDEIFEITRSEFEKDLECLFKRISQLLQKNIEIDEFIFIGGGARIPFLQEKIKDYFSEKTQFLRVLNQDESAAIGAAYYASKLSGSLKTKNSLGNFVINSKKIANHHNENDPKIQTMKDQLKLIKESEKELNKRTEKLNDLEGRCYELKRKVVKEEESDIAKRKVIKKCDEILDWISTSQNVPIHKIEDKNSELLLVYDKRNIDQEEIVKTSDKLQGDNQFENVVTENHKNDKNMEEFSQENQIDEEHGDNVEKNVSVTPKSNENGEVFDNSTHNIFTKSDFNHQNIEQKSSNDGLNEVFPGSPPKTIPNKEIKRVLDHEKKPGEKIQIKDELPEADHNMNNVFNENGPKVKAMREQFEPILSTTKQNGTSKNDMKSLNIPEQLVSSTSSMKATVPIKAEKKQSLIGKEVYKKEDSIIKDLPKETVISSTATKQRQLELSTDVDKVPESSKPPPQFTETLNRNFENSENNTLPPSKGTVKHFVNEKIAQINDLAQQGKSNEIEVDNKINELLNDSRLQFKEYNEQKRNIHFVHANIHFKFGNIENAIKIASQALEFRQNTSEIYELIGLCYFEKNNLIGARENFDKVKNPSLTLIEKIQAVNNKIYHQYVEEKLKTVGLLYKQKQYRPAQKVMNEITIQATMNDELKRKVLFCRANILCALRNYPLAIQDYDKALKLNINDNKAWLLRAETNFQLDKYKETMHDCDQIPKTSKHYEAARALRAKAVSVSE